MALARGCLEARGEAWHHSKGPEQQSLRDLILRGLRPVPGEWDGPGLLKAQAYPRLAVTPWGLAAGQSPPAWGVADGACQWGG